MRVPLAIAALLLLGLAAAPAASGAAASPAGAPVAAKSCYGVVLGGGLTGACLMDPDCRGPSGAPGIGTYQDGRRTGCIYF